MLAGALRGPSALALTLASQKPAPWVRAALDRAFRVVSAPGRKNAEMRELQLDAAAGALPARLYEPNGLGAKPGLLVFFHGGAYVVWSLTSHDNLCRFIARQAGCNVLSVGYRKAPEHRFPAAFEHAGAGVPVGGRPRRRVGHRSRPGRGRRRQRRWAARAGAALHTDDGPRPSHAWLLSPLADPDVAACASADLFERGPLLKKANALGLVNHYLPDAQSGRDFRMTLIDSGDLHRMPPTFVATAGIDPIRAQDELFAAQLGAAGVIVGSERFENLPHAFTLLLLDAGARRASARARLPLARAGRRSTTPAGTGRMY